MSDDETSDVVSLAPEFPRNWIESDVIGKGGFGQVFIVLDENNPTEKKYVGKQINISLAKKDRAQNIVELDILMTIKHPSIVSFYGYEQKESNMILFFEYLSMGSIGRFVKINGALTEEKIKLYTRQILEGLKYLHERNPPIIHRDVKGDNILLKDENNVKLTDFGLSKVITTKTNAKTVTGTFYWMAPEVAFATEDNYYNEKADIWSVGCTIVEMATTNPPYAHLSPREFFAALFSKISPIYTLSIPASEAMKDILAITFQFDPASRPSASDLLGHVFIV